MVQIFPAFIFSTVLFIASPGVIALPRPSVIARQDSDVIADQVAVSQVIDRINAVGQVVKAQQPEKGIIARQSDPLDIPTPEDSLIAASRHQAFQNFLDNLRQQAQIAESG